MSVTIRDMRKALSAAGFEKMRTTGSHEMWRGNGRTVVLPVVSLNQMVARRLIKENNLQI